MNPEDFTATTTGVCHKTLQGYHAFSPGERPPSLSLDWNLVRLISEADRALAELSGAGQLLPNPHFGGMGGP